MKENTHTKSSLITNTKHQVKKSMPKLYAFASKNKKKLLWILPLILLIGFLVFRPKGADSKATTVIPVEQKKLTSTIKASGSVTSVIDIELSFKESDTVSAVSVSVGQKASKGQILATLSNQSELGVVNQARGTLQAAQAGLARTLEGATNEETKVAEVLLENAKEDYKTAKAQQDISVENARRALYSNGLIARPTESNSDSVLSPAVFGTYTGDQEGKYVIQVYRSSGGYGFYVSGLSGEAGTVSVSNAVSIGYGLSIQFPSGFTLGSNKIWEINVPNTESSSYTTNLSAYQLAQSTRTSVLASAESVVKQREAELALKKAQARPSDILAKQAEVLRAQGVLQSALGAYENTVIRAPADGTVTKVAVKVGELAKSLEPAIVIQDVSGLYVEANINESNITTVLPGQPVLFTIDAFGSERTFQGSVVQVDLAPTIEDGIVNYKIKASIDEEDPLIKSGMNTNLVVTTGTKENVLAVPGAALVRRDGKVFVRKITNEKKKKYTEVEVVIGTTGDGNMVEILSGLVLGDKVALIEKK
jgi:RND family efflux transporter MFP subunit